MFRRSVVVALWLFLFIAHISAHAQDEDVLPLGETMAALPELSLFSQAMTLYGFDEFLNDADLNYTVFALDDGTLLQLFKDLGDYASLDEVSAGKDAALLGDILRYHITPGLLSADALGALDDRRDEPVNLAGGLPGTAITVGDRLLNAETKIKTADIPASNGVIHIIDNALIPDAAAFGAVPGLLEAHIALMKGYAQHQTIAEQLRASGSFTLLTKALDIAGLLDALDTSGPYTLFVMNDAALTTALDAADTSFDEFVSDPDALRHTLLYHMLPGQVSSALLKSPDDVFIGTMLPDAALEFTTTDDVLRANAARILTTDVLASNGVIHIIDSPLSPPEN